jgi:hypothetical protein
MRIVMGLFKRSMLLHTAIDGFLAMEQVVALP